MTGLIDVEYKEKRREKNRKDGFYYYLLQNSNWLDVENIQKAYRESLARLRKKPKMKMNNTTGVDNKYLKSSQYIYED